VGSQLVEALSNKPEGPGFDSRWCHCRNASNFLNAYRITFNWTHKQVPGKWKDNIKIVIGKVRGFAVGSQLVEALSNKPEGQGFDSRWYHCNFSLTQSFRPHCSPRVNSASNRK